MICLILHILIALNDSRVLTGDFWFYQNFKPLNLGKFGPNWAQKWPKIRFSADISTLTYIAYSDCSYSRILTDDFWFYQNLEP